MAAEEPPPYAFGHEPLGDEEKDELRSYPNVMKKKRVSDESDMESNNTLANAGNSDRRTRIVEVIEPLDNASNLNCTAKSDDSIEISFNLSKKLAKETDLDLECEIYLKEETSLPDENKRQEWEELPPKLITKKVSPTTKKVKLVIDNLIPRTDYSIQIRLVDAQNLKRVSSHSKVVSVKTNECMRFVSLCLLFFLFFFFGLPLVFFVFLFFFFLVFQ